MPLFPLSLEPAPCSGSPSCPHGTCFCLVVLMTFRVHGPRLVKISFDHEQRLTKFISPSSWKHFLYLASGKTHSPACSSSLVTLLGLFVGTSSFPDSPTIAWPQVLSSVFSQSHLRPRYSSKHSVSSEDCQTYVWSIHLYAGLQTCISSRLCLTPHWMTNRPLTFNLDKV